MFLRSIRNMAKRVFTRQKFKHKTCVECKPVTHEFLSNKGEAILGECRYSEYRFLLNEDTDCREYKPNNM